MFQDTSHVSVVTVGAEEVRVRDSAATHIALAPTRLSPDSFDRRSQSDSGSVASASSRRGADADSLATTASHDSAPHAMPHDTQLNGGTRSKEDIHIANLKKKTRKRTRKFEIDGVIVTTTTSKV
ncbi:hypothetical protein RR46_00093 [Papilio xuthus]|uniref:Uncharacterized protein n=1 Tax=Papilio xuthus TaxID=66420 RepID=A0A0N1I669_PAPXU|nr:hypothetical protein RR46_00093 [Papilio xuthus]